MKNITFYPRMRLLALLLVFAMTLSFVYACADNSKDGDSSAQEDGLPENNGGNGSDGDGESASIWTRPDYSDYIVFVDFEDNDFMGFDVRGTAAERESGTGVLTVSKDVARSGIHSLLITERNQAWNGPAYRVENIIEPGVEYTVSFWVHAKSPESSEFIVSTQVGEGAGATYNNIQKQTVSVSDGWVELRGNYIFDAKSEFITVYVENSDKEAEFYIDDFSLAPATAGGDAWNPETDPITSNRIGSFDGFDFEYWSDGTDMGSMLLTGGGTFTCEWTGSNILFRTGKKLGSVSPYTDYGRITIDFEAVHNFTGPVNYLTVYGWTQGPLMEYYILENRGSYRPAKDYIGTITVDGAEYEVYTDLRENKDSIEGKATFLQIFSIRTEGRTEGSITVSDHFKAWEDLGLDISGNLYEVSMCVEAYNTGGSAELTKFILTIGDETYE